MASDRTDDEYDDGRGDRPRRRRGGGGADRGRSALLGPAIGLIVTGVLAMAGGGFYLVQGLNPTVQAEVDKEIERRKAEVDLKTVPADQKQAEKDGMDMGAKAVKTAWVPLSASVTLGGLVILVGGIQMLRAKTRGLAMTASVLAMIPCFSGLCCLIGLPIGIWGLVTLGNPDVKAAFASGSRPAFDDYPPDDPR